jgi:hypothetical protein
VIEFDLLTHMLSDNLKDRSVTSISVLSLQLFVLV